MQAEESVRYAEGLNRVKFVNISVRTLGVLSPSKSCHGLRGVTHSPPFGVVSLCKYTTIVKNPTPPKP
eukprot:6966282-Pyramimonas_sp.AAC.1